jgi:hypothetical protein
MFLFAGEAWLYGEGQWQSGEAGFVLGGTLYTTQIGQFLLSFKIQ